MYPEMMGYGAIDPGMIGPGMILLGTILIGLGLLILIFGVRIARIYAVLSALALAISVGFWLVNMLIAILHFAGNMIIPILAVLAIAGVLLYWVAKAYMAYLKIYAFFGLIKIAGSILLLFLVLLQIRGGLVVVALLAVLAAFIWMIIKIFSKWNHLLYMLGIMTDGSILCISGGIAIGLSTGHAEATAAISVLCIPFLIVAGLYRECWRQQLLFPGIKTW